MKEGVILVDTPGIGSIHENNTQITKRYLKYADVAVFVLAVYPPMTKEEVDFLTTVKEITDKMIFVLNKVDTVSDNEQQEILDFSTKLIQEEIGMEKAIVYPLTAKKALKESFFANKQHQQFIQDLERLILGKKGEIIIYSVSDKIVKVAQQLLFHLELENKAIQEPLISLEEKINKAEEQLKTITKKKKESIYLFRGAMEEIIKNFEEDLLDFKEKETQRLLDMAEQEISEEKKGNIQERIKDLLEKEIKRNFEIWRQEKKKALDRQLKKKTEEFVTEINQIMQEIQTIFTKLFNIDFYQLNSVEEMIESRDFYYHIKEIGSFYPKLELASFSPLLPSSMRNNVIRKKIREEVITQVDKNCGRMRYDFSYRISETAKLFIYRWENEVEKLITRIKNIVNKAREEKRKNIQAVEIRAKELQDDLIKIKNLITEFKTN